MNRTTRVKILLAIITFYTFLCSPSFAQETTVKDPYERFNRAMFKFNDTIDTFLFKPLAELYNKIMPKPLNKGIHNAFTNLNTIPTIANDILQLHFYQMTSDIWRFAINSTIGIGGLFDVAKSMGLEPYTNDFGLTLAHYGWKNSLYLVLPFFGPNSIRDTIEIPVDYYAFTVYPWIHDRPIRYSVLGLYFIDNRAQLLKFQSVMEEASLDKYLFVRNAYIQRRAYQIEQNQAQRFLLKATPLKEKEDDLDDGDFAQSDSKTESTFNKKSAIKMNNSQATTIPETNSMLDINPSDQN